MYIWFCLVLHDQLVTLRSILVAAFSFCDHNPHVLFRDNVPLWNRFCVVLCESVTLWLCISNAH